MLNNSLVIILCFILFQVSRKFGSEHNELFFIWIVLTVYTFNSLLNYWVFPIFWLSASWRLFQKRVVRTNLDTCIYVFITITGSIPHWWTSSPLEYHRDDPPSSKCFCLLDIYLFLKLRFSSLKLCDFSRFWFSYSQTFLNYLDCQSFDFRAHDTGYCKNVSCALNLISTFLSIKDEFVWNSLYRKCNMGVFVFVRISSKFFLMSTGHGK